MKQVVGASRYFATECGEIWDSVLGRYKVQTLNGIPQYQYTTIDFDDGTTKLSRVHRLVAIAWHDNPDNLPMVDHKDRNKLNNHKDNLQWVTRSTNNRNTSSAVYVEWCGESIMLVELVDKLYGIQKPHYAYIWSKLNRGASIDQAIADNNRLRESLQES